MSERILIVEDDPDIVRVVEAYLQREGFATDVAGDGAAGLAAALATPPALIVLDWMLPQLDGEAFMRRDWLQIIRAIRDHGMSPSLQSGGYRLTEEKVKAAADAGASDVAAHGIGPADAVIGLAASGGTPYTVAAVEEAGRRGALTVGLANSAGSALLRAAAHPILVETGAEAVAGSTRMKAGTAQKVVLNLLSTLVMVRLGRVYRGRMVDMVARNAKLRRRAERMLGELTGCEADAGRAALQAADGKVKLAVLILRGMTREQAGALLAAHGGDLRRAVARIEAG